MRNILFLCEHNSASSQIAAAYLNKYAADRFYAESAGLEPGVLNAYVVEVLAEERIDISGNRTQSVFEMYKRGRRFDVVITVCSPDARERCPIFPGRTLRLGWLFDDPSQFVGSRDEILAQTRIIRDRIKEKILTFIREYDEKGLKLFIGKE